MKKKCRQTKVRWSLLILQSKINETKSFFLSKFERIFIFRDFYKKRNLFLCVVCLLSTVVTLTAIGLGIGLIVKYSSKSSTSSFDFTSSLMKIRTNEFWKEKFSFSVKTKTIAMGFASDCSMCRNGYLGNLKSVDEQVRLISFFVDFDWSSKSFFFFSWRCKRVFTEVKFISIRHFSLRLLPKHDEPFQRTSSFSFLVEVFDAFLLIFFRSFSCERPTSLFGDIFSLRVQYTYPILCYSNACRLQYDQTVKIAFRNNLQPLSIHVNLTDGQNRDVQLKFCSFHTIVN